MSTKDVLQAKHMLGLTWNKFEVDSVSGPVRKDEVTFWWIVFEKNPPSQWPLHGVDRSAEGFWLQVYQFVGVQAYVSDVRATMSVT